MTKRTDEASVVVDYTYDAANRLTERKKSTSSTDVETYVYDGLGRLITAEKGTSSNADAVAGSAFTYDSLSQVNEECQSIAEGSGRSVSYAYDKAGNRTEVIYHTAATTASYAYDSRDRATSIDNGSQRLADYTWIGRAIHQRDTTCDYPGATKPKFKTAFERDGILRVTKVDNEHLTSDQATSGYNDLGEFAYTYDAASNPLTVLQANGMGKLDADRWYAYDTLNRVITSEYSDYQMWSTPQSNDTSSYVYDDLGNRSSHSYRDAASIGYEHDKANRMTKLAGLDQGYDLAGNLTLAYSADRGTSYIYKYDHHNRLTGVYDDADTTRKAAFTYDALGRRIEHVNDVLSTTTRYFYDGVNEIVETDGSDDRLRYYIHGVSYVDERLMMMDYKDTAESDDDRPYYYTLDRMYNVRFLVDRAGALVERYMYDAYGRPHIRESCGRGDMNNETILTSTDSTRFTDAKNGTIWDPRADMDDDGDVDANDQTAYDTKVGIWPPPTFGAINVKQAFSDVNNPFMFQGRPHFALDTVASATAGKLMINDHRARMNDPVTGRWLTRDPYRYNQHSVTMITDKHGPYLIARTWGLALADAKRIYAYLLDNPISTRDPMGTQDNAGEYRCLPFSDNDSGTGPNEEITVNYDPNQCPYDCTLAHELTHQSQMYSACFFTWIAIESPGCGLLCDNCMSAVYNDWVIENDAINECDAYTVSAACFCTQVEQGSLCCRSPALDGCVNDSDAADLNCVISNPRTPFPTDQIVDCLANNPE